ncbi:HAD-IIB family hydrolase [Thermodesulfobacteriota bacterium]
MFQDDKKGDNSLFFLIFTDLDGTLLDSDSYSWEDAKPALCYCQKNGIPVVIVSSKTRAEIEVLQRDMKLNCPFISENGGGIYFPGNFPVDQSIEGILSAGEKSKLILGKPYDYLVSQLDEISMETGIRLKGFSQMSQGEIIKLTGLSREECDRAIKRDFDEPFIILDEDIDIDTIHFSAENRGLIISEGGRFLHLHGQSDKGKAINRLISIYESMHGRIFSIALGDSPNDFAMFESANQAVLIKSIKHFNNLGEMFPGIIITEKQGPEGWNVAVLEILKTKRGFSSDV